MNDKSVDCIFFKFFNVLSWLLFKLQLNVSYKEYGTTNWLTRCYKKKLSLNVLNQNCKSICRFISLDVLLGEHFIWCYVCHCDVENTLKLRNEESIFLIQSEIQNKIFWMTIISKNVPFAYILFTITITIKKKGQTKK